MVFSKERAQYGDNPYPTVYARIRDITVPQLKENNASWHRNCYANACHKKMLEAAKSRYEKSVQSRKNPSLSQFPGQPSTPTTSTVSNPEVEVPERAFTRSSSAPYLSSLCFFCQTKDPKDKLHEVTSFNAGETLRAAVKRSSSDTLQVRLSTAIDPKGAHTIDVKYHLKCWMKNVEHVLSRSTKTSTEDEERPQRDSTEHQRYVLAETEFFSMLGESLQEGSILQMADLEKVFSEIKTANGIAESKIDR